MDYDVIIAGGTVVDGSESATSVRTDVGITGDTIRAVGDLSAAHGTRVIDATAKTVTPGFIDMHTHSDFPSLKLPTADSKVRQGVTTEVLGQCGASAFPLRGEARERRLAAYERGELKIDWTDIDGYVAEADKRGCSVNRALMVGHGTIRGSVMGYVDHPPSPDQLRQMIREVEIALEHGVFGLTTGLVYPPGCYAATDEIVELCRPVAAAGGLYASHIRSENDGLETAIEEILEICERAGVGVHVSHLKCSRHRNWHKIDWLERRLFDARDAGVDVTADRYPYAAASTGLNSFLPNWVHEGTGPEVIERLRDAKTRERLRHETLQSVTDEDWASAMVSSCEQDKNRRWEGMRLTEVAREMGLGPFDALCELLISDGGRTGGVFFRMKEENLKEILHWPFVMIGSDGSDRSADRAKTYGNIHPRSYGTNVRVLGRYVREEGVLSLEEAVWKMTGFPAARLGLEDRGKIAHNMKADLVVFDADTVADKATYEEPHQYPVGVEHVFVNGALTVEDGTHLGTLAGRVLRRS